MNMQVLGCSHQNAPLSFRERLSFVPEQVCAALGALRREFPGADELGVRALVHRRHGRGDAQATDSDFAVVR